MTVSLQAPQFPSVIKWSFRLYLCPNSKRPHTYYQWHESQHSFHAAVKRSKRTCIYCHTTSTPSLCLSLPGAMTHPLSTMNVPSPFPFHMYPLLARFVREAPQDREPLLVTTHFTHSILSQPQPVFTSPTPLCFDNLVPLILFDHLFRQLLFAVHIPNRAQFLPTATTIFRTYINMPPSSILTYPGQEIKAQLQIVVRVCKTKNGAW
jgi:hypothetical protein